MSKAESPASFDIVVIGAGPGGEAVTHKARELGASVAVIDRRWFGGSCPHIGCLPSKALLHGAAEHRANPQRYGWPRASTHRDYMINRAAEAPEPDDSSHVRSLERAGAVVYRGEGRIIGRGQVRVAHDGMSHELSAPTVVVAVGSVSRPVHIPGIEAIDVWSNEQGTLTRDLPKSMLILGGGPTGCELAQVYARFGVPVTIVQSGPRLAPTDHPRNSEVVRATLEADGVDVRTGVRAVAAHARAGADGAHVIDLDNGSTAEGHVVMAAIGREIPFDDIGLEHYGLDTSGRTPPYPRDGRLRLAEGLYAVGDAAGPELHTHQAWYQGELAARMIRGEKVTPDYRALPRATYTDPEAAFVGASLEQAKEAGLDAFELVADFAKSDRGYGLEAKLGHVTIVIDRGSRELVGAAIACPDASAAIHECVLAIKAHVTVDVLADTIQAFPSTSRIFTGLFASALKKFDEPASKA
jgi:pyruvate/2-oxoglutarate dehydrogenase complex dihydrolipoamide dehydrogenase (E3) component